MKTQFKILPWTISLFLLTLSCSLTPSPAKVNKFPPYQSIGINQQSNDQDKQRYVIADLQLSGALNNKKTSENLHNISPAASSGVSNPAVKNPTVVNNNNSTLRYYQQFLQDANINGGIQNFFLGDVVINIYQFDRIDLGSQGWQVVYGGTQLPVNAADFVMASDIGGLNNEEARIRYILVDSQLGNVIDYYRQFTDQPAVAEAVARWDQGVRVVNIDQFERKIVSQAGWKVVYVGTTHAIDGMAVTLTTDASNAEAQVRYILADSQIGSVIDYYRQFVDAPNVREAVCRWDAGVRVENQTSFERKVVGDKGWQITYAGTENSINGMDISLSTNESCSGLNQSNPQPSGFATINFMIGYPTDVQMSYLPGDLSLDVTNKLDGNTVNGFWRSSSLINNIQVPAPGEYILKAHLFTDTGTMMFLFSADCVNESSIVVSPGDSTETVTLLFCGLE